MSDEKTLLTPGFLRQWDQVGMIRIISRLVPAVQLTFSPGFRRERPGKRLHQVWKGISLCKFPLDWLNPMEEQPPRDHDPKSSTLKLKKRPPSYPILPDEKFFSPKMRAGKRKRKVDKLFFQCY